jgi:NADH:ubiquinone oxidoreductase subunit 5 (subunit L)/multisubunit Na+/H+ antiporter MnhA subunit
MYASIVMLPLVGSLFAGLRGRTVGSQGAQLVSTVCVVLSTVLCLVAFYEVALCRSPVRVTLCH